jgi:hypothetical protein
MILAEVPLYHTHYHMHHSNQNKHICRMNYMEIGAHLNDLPYHAYLITIVTHDFIFTSSFQHVVLNMHSIPKTK